MAATQTELDGLLSNAKAAMGALAAFAAQAKAEADSADQVAAAAVAAVNEAQSTTGEAPVPAADEPAPEPAA
jgi:hypothetical protein